MVLEGLDGAGTTTQTRELVRRLLARRLKAEGTAEPSQGPIGALVRSVLQRRVVSPAGDFDRGALALLFAADRLDHAQSEILPRLKRGIWVVCDRYVLSSLAYQGLDLSPAFIAQINALAPRPDLTLFLDVPSEVSLRRRKAELSSADLFETSAVQKRVAKNYAAALKGAPGVDLGPCVVLDGTRDIAAVAQSIETVVISRLTVGRPVARRASGKPAKS